MEDLVGKPVSFEVTGVIKSYSIEDETDEFKNIQGRVFRSDISTLRKIVVIGTPDGGEVIVNTIGPVKIAPLED